MAENANLHCSFCGKSAKEVKKLIAGPDVYVCDECVGKCHDILHEPGAKSKGATTENPKAKSTPKSPREIKEFLDQYVVGQDDAKQVLSVAVYNHYKRLENPVVDGVEIEKENCLLLGPSGSGKTHLLQTLARILDVPFAIADATALTEAGYVGEDVESIVTRLLVSVNGDVAKCERGIIFLDEIDKLSRKSVGNATGRDVSGEGVQQALLKLLEGSDVMVPVAGIKKSPNSEMVKINTRNILFVVGGAFVGLEKVVEQTLDGVGGIGFGASTIEKGSRKLTDIFAKLEPEHLIQYGLIPELVGRIPVIVALNELSEDQLVLILTEPKNALTKQYSAMFSLDGISLEFDEDSLRAVAKQAKKQKTGGRALRNVLQSKLVRTQFMLPDLYRDGVRRIIVNKSTIENNALPQHIHEIIKTLAE